MTSIAIITARGGSKRIPKKNTRLFCGKPLISWTIQAALQSKCFDEVIVSTDDLSIAEISKNSGASIPFIRPEFLAQDESTSLSVVNHCLEFFPSASHVMLLQPTSPLRRAHHIASAFEMMELCQCHSLVSVSTRDAKIALQYFIGDDYRIEPVFSSDYGAQKVVSINGAMYLFLRNWFDEKQAFTGANTCGFLMKPNDSVDIDTVSDWTEAEALALREQEMGTNGHNQTT